MAASGRASSTRWHSAHGVEARCFFSELSTSAAEESGPTPKVLPMRRPSITRPDVTAAALRHVTFSMQTRCACSLLSLNSASSPQCDFPVPGGPQIRAARMPPGPQVPLATGCSAATAAAIWRSRSTSYSPEKPSTNACTPF
jgi:hypothetical protein